MPDALTERDRHLLKVSIDHHVEALRKACAEDQGDPDGRPGTLGNELQRDLADLKERL